jgi:hypothetical protein
VSRDRDRILEQALKHELRAAGTPPAGACLDAETLGAWTDGGLDPAAMATAEAHVANCARCQAMAATFARSAPVIEAGPETSRVSIWKWWLAPLAAGVAATTLWMVVPEQQQIATAPPHAKAADAVPAPATTEAAAPPAPAKGAASERFAARDSDLAASAREARQRAMQANAERKEEAARLQDQVAMADAAARAAEAPPPAAAAPPAPAEIGALQKRLAIAPIEINTLDPSLVWRIVGDRIERSGDGGKTWTLLRQQPGDGITAGSAPSNAVCWFVGRAGRVLLTTNSGATFTDISLAEPLDLASVAATDARSAAIYSVVGRRFRTDDGGRTWRPF